MSILCLAVLRRCRQYRIIHGRVARATRRRCEFASPTASNATHAPDSVAVGGKDLSAGAGAQRPVSLQVDRVLDELDRAVGEQKVAAAGVVAGGIGVKAIGVTAPRLIQPAAGPAVLPGIGRDDRVEGGDVDTADGPAETLVVQ